MKKSTILAAMAAACIATGAQAVEIQTEVVPMTYFKHEFGGTAKSQQFTSYGLQVHRMSPLQSGLFSNARPAAFDLRFREGQLDAMSFAGINTVRKQLVQKADGGTATAASVDWELVVPAAIAAGIIVYGVTRDRCTPAPVTLADVMHTAAVDSCGNPLVGFR